ncbi:MAG: NADH-quinone oxidoreductase subunit E [Bacteroidetes bacterium 4572_112]|nr:MAG: NADH-quinone oxidoreductase subunit E [Bacteroidetes bacterium 4572_112]
MSNKGLRKVDILFSQYSVAPYQILKQTMKKNKADVLTEINESGLRGRGGAGFPTGMKWQIMADEKAEEKYIICNADEGEPGTFKDRKLLVEVPRKVISGMAIAAWITNSTKGYIYLRAEYNYLIPALKKELEVFEEYSKQFGLDFPIEIFSGSGAYVCGEETALIESMEGKRGEPRNKPPFPTQEGYLGKPTLVNNVETLASVSMVCRYGSEKYKSLGTDAQRGSKLFSLSGDSPKEGVHEFELGMKVSDFVAEYGDGDTKAIQVGGVAGYCIPRKNFENTIIGEGNTTGGATMIFNSTRSMYNVIHNYLEFFVEESCGQCTPCRVGTQQLLKGIEAVKVGDKPECYLQDLIKLSKTMKITSKCGLGQSVTNSFTSIITNFPEEMIY